MQRSWWRQALVVVLFLLIASCSGGGCSSGCSSCGIAPIAAGFPSTNTIPNSASARVTQHGLGFLSANIGTLVTNLLGRSGTPGIIDYPIPTLQESVDGISVTICPNGSNASSSPPICLAEINIGGATLTVSAVSPDNLSLSGTIPIRARDLQVTGIPIINGVDIALGSNGTCPSSAGGSDADFANIPVTISLPLISDPKAPHEGYTMVDAANATVGITIASGDIKLCASDCGILGVVCNAILSLLPGTIASALQTPLETQIKTVLEGAVCTKANADLSPACPTGTHPAGGDAGLPPVAADGGITGTEPNCVLDSDNTTCLPIELGTEGHMNLGALVASISPGTTGALDFMLAAGGNMNPVNSGMTLGLLGGALPQPQSNCVPVAANPAPTGLTIPDELTGNTVTPWPAGDPGPDIGLALNSQFLTYAFGSAYNSGLLCLGVTTDFNQELNTGLVSFLVPSLKTLTFEEGSAAMAITTRPQQAPLVTLGGGTNLTTDPLITILMKTFAIDFYVWSEDRFIRAFTYTADITVPVNLTTNVTTSNPNGGLLPAIGTLTLANAALSNNELISDDPTKTTNGLTSILGSIVGQLLGSGFSPIDISSALNSFGLGLNIPAGGIRELTKGSETYVGIFGDLSLAGAQIVPQIETGVRLVDLTVHPEGMTLAGVQPATAPSLHVMFDSPADNGTAPVEYSWRIDQGTWTEWARDRDVTIVHPMLYMQAKHTLSVVSRVVGQPLSQDPTPAQIAFTIDVLPPNVGIVEKDDAPSGFAIKAVDIVSPQSALMGRTRGTDTNGVVGAWTDWMPVTQMSVAPGLSAIDVEARDEIGNIGKISSALIRGRGDPTLPVTGGCTNGCSAASQSSSGWPAIALGIAGIAALFSRRRTSRAASAVLALGSIIVVASTSQGCSCGSPGGTDNNDNGGGKDAGHLPDGAPIGSGDDAGPVCGQGCNQVCGPELPQGLIGAYTSIAKSASGTLWVAGYNDAALDPNNDIQALYGDLVVGKYDPTANAVAWVTVDGLPPKPANGTCPDNDPNGWRGGDSDSGPDVGLWTSLQLDANGNPMVAYYDATNTALKFASSSDGITWAVHTVYSNAGSDIGRYAKMQIVNGKPVVAFLAVDTGTNGYSKTRVTIAQANVATPAQASDWSLEDALVDTDSPCRAQDCQASQACVLSTTMCTTLATGCTATCATGEACISTAGTPTCVKVATTNDLHPYPDAVGDYISLQVTSSGLGMVVYDRIHGNLLGLTNATGSWVVTILDGETGSRANGTAVDTGDDGVGASLVVASNGDWHVSYVDGITETLKYLYVPGGTLVNTLVPQMVDDGSAVDGAVFSDGIHIVGDDSSVQVNSDGSISITYQDATAGTLRVATGAQTPGKWTLHAVSQPSEFAGFFPHFVPGDTTVANWWRWVDQTTQIITGNVSIVSTQ
jgi:hypothetical protein